MGKSALTSKVLWFNVLMGIALVLTQSSADIANAVGVAADPKVQTTVATIGNIILRFLTSQPIKSVT